MAYKPPVKSVEEYVGDIPADMRSGLDVVITQCQPRQNRSASNAYYNEKNSMIWKEVIEKVFDLQQSIFIDARQLGRGSSTIYVKANMAIKWFIEKHPDSEVRDKWQKIRMGTTIREVKSEEQVGILICPKMQLMVIAAAKSLGVTEALSGNVFKGINLETILDAAGFVEDKRRKRWQGKFFLWVQTANKGDVFRYPEGEDKLEPYMFARDDETWLLEFITASCIELSDYGFNLVENVFTAMK